MDDCEFAIVTSLPWIQSGLTTAYNGASLVAEVVEPFHDHGGDGGALMRRHAGRHAQEHEHIVAVGHAHRVQVGQHVGAGDLAHDVGVVDEREEEVSGLHQRHIVAQWNHTTVEASTNANTFNGRRRCRPESLQEL